MNEFCDLYMDVIFSDDDEEFTVEFGETTMVPGAGGVSPTVELSKKDGVTTLTITDVNGTQSVEILDGKDGSGGGVDFETDDTLTLENGVLSVNTADDVEKDNTLPVTSAAVYTEVGNINALLATI